MILIPEIQTVVILVPRTGSGSLKRAIAKKYPRSMLLYRHMEADGVPQGYDRWSKLGVIRQPTDRLWSLYKFLRSFDGPYEPAYIAAQRASVADMDFSAWIVNNAIPFTHPYDSSGDGRFFPGFTVRHPLPETKKSQHFYLRPDLGTVIYRFDELNVLASTLGIDLERHNHTDAERRPALSQRAIDHMARYFAWDYTAWQFGVHAVTSTKFAANAVKEFV